MPKFKCPHCQEELEYVNYTANTSGWERGSAKVNNNGDFADHECEDSETNEASDYEYSCPECDEPLEESDLERIEEKEEEEEETPKNEDGEELKPPNEKENIKKFIAEHENNFIQTIQRENIIICIKCGQTNLTKREELEEETAECSKCGQQLTKNKYIKLTASIN